MFIFIYIFLFHDLDVGNTDEFCYLMVEKESEELTVPGGWDVIQIDDFSSHSTYPTLVGEMMNGFIKIFGKRPGSTVQHLKM